MSLSDEDAMRMAITRCREGIDAGQTPFGSILVRDGRVLASEHNTVWRDFDPTAHAEVNAIRSAGRSLQTIDLGGSTLYTTCEPCPMCLAAAHWAKVDRVVFGASIGDAHRFGFQELQLSARELAERGGSPVVVDGPLLEDECVALFEEFKRVNGRSY